MCNSMYLVDKNLGKIPYFRRIGECLDFLGPRGPGFIPPKDGGILKSGIPRAPTNKGNFGR